MFATDAYRYYIDVERKEALYQKAWPIAFMPSRAAERLMLGAALSLIVTRLAAQELYDVTATDPVVFFSAALVVAVAALLAADIPARRATRVDPAGVLRR